MDTNANGPLLPEGPSDDVPLLPEEPGDEELPVIALSPDLDQRQRAKALSQLSLQSLGSDNYDAADAGDDDEMGKYENKVKPFKLHQASLTGDEAEVRHMLSRDSDVNLLDKSGRTPIHNAILGRHVKIMEMLLEAGADTTRLDESQDAPLQTAVRSGDENLVRVFLQRALNSHVDIRGHSSRTALHIAADMDKVAICKLLMEHGASPDCRDYEQMTPLTRAVEKGSKNTATFFFEDGL